MTQIITEDILQINKLLIEHFGIDTDSNQPIWRITWSHDQYEYRMTDCDDKGNELIHPEIRLLPKYKQWVNPRWILERLVLVPSVNSLELAGMIKSYELMWTFEDKDENPLPPKFEACKFIIDTVYAAQGKSSLAKYVDEDAKNPMEARQARINKLETELFGNETPVGDALSQGRGVGYTGPKDN